MDHYDFQANLRRYRKMFRYTQEDLGKKLGVNAKTICAWETGIRSPKVDEFIRMCEIFHCQPNELLLKV